MKISEFSIKRPITIVVLFLTIGILGLLGYRSMQTELMPKFTPPTMNVQVIYPGSTSGKRRAAASFQKYPML
jgi:HAE1 family hydrophobic/amphiphilic exporter-1